MKPTPAPVTGENRTLVPDAIRNLIIGRARINLAFGTEPAQSEKALDVLRRVSPNNIYFSEVSRTSGREEIEIGYSLPLSRLRFVQIIDVIKASGIGVEGWERLA